MSNLNMTNLTEEQINTLDNMVQQFHSLKDSNTQLEQRMIGLEQQYQQQFIDFGTEIHEYIANHSTLTRNQPNTSLRLKPPTSFNGNSNHCDSFFMQLSIVFAADEARFYNDEKKILFAISCLSGNALSYMEPYLKNMDSVTPKHEILINYQHFKKIINDTFGDSNPVVNAESALRALKHVGSASSYATQFRKLSMQLTWNNDALVSQFLLNLKDNIKDELARREPITELTLLINCAIDIDNRLFSRYKQKNPKFQPTSHHRQHASTPTPMDINVISNSSNYDSRKYHSPLSTAEKERRSKNNLCMYCGQPGHFTNVCPVKTSRFTSGQSSISTILIDNDNQPASINVITNSDINLITTSNKRKSHDELVEILHHSVRHKQRNIESAILQDTLYVTESTDPNLFVVPVTIKFGNCMFTTSALIDSGASASFIDATLVRQTGLPSSLSSNPTSFRLADNSLHESTMCSTVFLQLANTHHEEFITLRHLNESAHSIILGMDWLRRHDPGFQFRGGVMALTCLFRDCTPTHLHSVSQIPVVNPFNTNEIIMPTISTIIGSSSSVLAPGSPINGLRNPNHFDQAIVPNISPITSPIPISLNQSDEINSIPFEDNYLSDYSRLCETINLNQIQRTTLSSDSTANIIEVTTIQDTNSAAIPDTLEVETQTTNFPEIISDHSEIITIVLPSKYQDFAIVFSKTEADRLPPHRSCDHTIPLIPDSIVPFGPLYNLSKTELDTLYEYIQENLAKGFIERSESPCGAPVLFVKKKDCSLRLCVDFRSLNKLTVPNRCPLPLISETLDRLHTGVIFTKLDMRGAYNLIRIAPGEEWKTAFRTRYGHFQYKVMPFGLRNAPATFQAFVNDVLREYLDSFVVVYLDDILIYSSSESEHTHHVRLVLQKLQDHQLSLKLEKCEFDVKTVQFLGFVISPSSISMDPEKVTAIQNWKAPTSVHDVQVFLGLTNFYRRFIANYSKQCVPLTALLKKDTIFHWSTEADIAFVTLKNIITSNPVLRHFNPELPCIIETDASDFALGAVCSQADTDGVNHPIAFYSRKLLPAERNYQIYDKELLAIVVAFRQWRHYLEFSQASTIVITDHKNLEYFTTTRNLSRRQVRWAEFLGDYNFVITYRAARLNGAADALSRKDKPLEGGDSSSKTPMTLLNPNIFINSLTTVNIEPEQNEIVKNIIKLLPNDPVFAPIILDISNGCNTDTNYSLSDNILFYKGSICVPYSTDIKRVILHECHDLPASGHFGNAKTYDMVARNYYWPGMRKYIKDYISGCDTCLRNKNSHHKPYGLLQPLPVPDTPWASVSVDFITQLPPSNDFTAICVFVDRFSKMALFIPSTNQIDAEGTSELFIKHVFCHFGLPSDMVSDRGATFTSKFTQYLLRGLQIKQKLSTAFHPQTDGQTERVNSVLEQYLRCYINYQQSDWSTYLPIAQFAYNNAKHSTTEHTPFYAVFGYHPRLSVTLPRSNKDQTPADQRLQNIHNLHEEMKFNIKLSLEKHSQYYNKRVTKGPSYQVGDKVWLSTKNIKSQRPTGKLDYKRLGPFPIIEAIGSRSFKLQLPPTMKIYPVFHTNLLEPFVEDAIEGRSPTALPPVIIDQHQEYEVESIVDSRLHRRKLQYLVHWKGYSTMDRTWERAGNLTHCDTLLRDFHLAHPSRPSGLSQAPP